MGLAVAQRLAAEGARVALLGRRAAPLEDAAAFVTGQDITIDGGYTLGGLRP
ncbi:hypothetical protein [Rhodospirillum sp. A1_3_36]|uniref:hypothetical protein n=1 Tax=Rhodospirillum sp. A1_3_36 TaxID=3391666 RepID=UPI0039A69BC0